MILCWISFMKLVWGTWSWGTFGWWCSKLASEPTIPCLVAERLVCPVDRANESTEHHFFFSTCPLARFVNLDIWDVLWHQRRRAPVLIWKMMYYGGSSINFALCNFTGMEETSFSCSCVSLKSYHVLCVPWSDVPRLGPCSSGNWHVDLYSMFYMTSLYLLTVAVYRCKPELNWGVNWVDSAFYVILFCWMDGWMDGKLLSMISELGGCSWLLWHQLFPFRSC